MAYKRVKDLSTETVIKIGGVDTKTNKPNPKTIEGYYLGNRTITNDNGESKIQVFQTSKGNMGVWGTADLNAKLAQVKLGSMTLVEYKGKKNLKGGKTLHTYDVSEDTDNALEGYSAYSGDTGADSAVSDESYVEETENYVEDSSVDEDAQQSAALMAAERAAKAAKVQAILNQGKNKTK